MAEQEGAQGVDSTTPMEGVRQEQEGVQGADATTMATGSSGTVPTEQSDPTVGIATNVSDTESASSKVVILNSDAIVAVMTMPKGYTCYRCGMMCPYPFPRDECVYCGESPSMHCQNCCPVYGNQVLVALGSRVMQQKTSRVSQQ